MTVELSQLWKSIWCFVWELKTVLRLVWLQSDSQWRKIDPDPRTLIGGVFYVVCKRKIGWVEDGWGMDHINIVDNGFGKRDCNSRTKVRVEIVAFVGLKLCGIVYGENKKWRGGVCVWDVVTALEPLTESVSKQG